MKESVIDKETLLPLGMVIAIVSTFFGGIVWLNNVYNISKNNTEKIIVIQADLKSSQISMQNYNERVIRIEEKIDLLLQSQGIPDEKDVEKSLLE